MQYCNLENLTTLAAGSKEMINTVIDRFLDNAPVANGKLRKESANENWQTVRDVAHKMVNSSGMLGIEKLTDIYKEIEICAVKQQNLEKVPSLVEKAIELTGAASVELEQEKMKPEV